MISKVYKGSQSYFTGEALGNPSTISDAQEVMKRQQEAARKSQVSDPANQMQGMRQQSETGGGFMEKASDSTYKFIAKIINPMMWFLKARKIFDFVSTKPMVSADNAIEFLHSKLG
jgi:flagellum-specific peptidoglycan hydrolase FlgJ